MPQTIRQVLNKKTLAVVLASIHMNAAFAQEDQKEDSDLRLEEIIITAQKRAESMQEVPISVATVTGEKLEKAGIENLEGLTAHLTNIHFTQTGFSTQVRVRGIGSDNSQGFEQSVGMYIDGIHYSRAQLFRAPMFDLEIAELLRGPQGTLFGKNTIAGALNLTTAKPTDNFEGFVSISPEFEIGGMELNGVVSGPISDTVRARLALRSYEEDGAFYNEYKERDEAMVDEKAARLIVDWQATEDLTFELKLENSNYNTEGRAIEITQDVAEPSLREDMATDPEGPVDLGDATFSQVLQSLFSQQGFDPELDFVRSTNTFETSDNKIKNVTLNANYDFNNGYSLTYLGGAISFEYDEVCDCDFLPIEAVPLELSETYDQNSHELRIASPTGQSLEWIGGLYYQSYEQKFRDILNIYDNANVLPIMLDLPSLNDTATERLFEQESSSWAAFGQATWNITDSFSVTFGGRYTEETKDATKVVQLVQPSTGDIILDPAIGTLYWLAFQTESTATEGVFPFGGHDVKGSRDESKFLPMLNIVWNATDNIMTYFRYSKGYKAGGFDPRSNAVGADVMVPPELGDGDPWTPEEQAAEFAARQAVPENQNFEFENEDADTYELGMKSFVFNGRGEFNLALFRMDYENLQISQFDGGVGFNVGNAKETRSQGVELDGRLLLTDGLTASYGISWLDFEYLDFVNGNCYVGQEPDGIDTTGDGEVNTCDYTGKRGVYTPEYTVNAGLDYILDVSSDFDFVASIDAQYVDSHQVHVNQDPNGEVDGYTMLGAKIGLDAESWAVALRGKNLLNEEVISYTGNAPLSDRLGNNTHYSFVRAPRTIYLDLKVKF